MAWHAQLQVNYAFENGRTVARHLHTGPLRILQSLYPEGDAICHNVLIHPPGGLVGGDTLDLNVHAAAHTHALITTPGATRFYRSAGECAVQRTRLTLQADARLEWLPLEAICYNDCNALNHLHLELAAGAELIGWDITSLGLPSAQQPFVQGQFEQHIEMPGVWLERGQIHGHDSRLLHSPLGLAGHTCMASLFFIAGTGLTRPRKEQALALARDVIAAHPLASTSGATNPNGHVVVVRVLAPAVEPAMQLLKTVRRAWRYGLWNVDASDPRIWAM